MGSLLTDTGKDGRVTVFDTEQSTDRMGDARPEGERNFWNGTESVTARGPAFNSQQTLNIKEAEELRFEGGSDIFTSNRHQIHNARQSSDFKINFWSGDDSPVIRPMINPRQVYSAPRAPVLDGFGGEGCEKVTKLKLRSNLQWFKHSVALAVSGAVVFSGLLYLKKDKPVPVSMKSLT